MRIFTVFCDLSFCPVSYDFLPWLVRARMEAGGRPVHAVIVPKEDGLGGFSRHWGKHDAAAARWRLWHIVMAACPLAEVSVTLAASRDYAMKLCNSMKNADTWWPDGKAHFIAPVVGAARKGATVPLFKATEAAKRYVAAHLGGGDRVITLTLRNQTTDADRNTDPIAWDKFARWLMDSGRRVVILDDTNDALRAGRGYYEADLDLRLALYESAVMNVVGNNGPAEFLKFSSAPYMAFDLGLTDGWRQHFRKYCGLDVGEQLPWATPSQWLIYKPSTLDNLKAEFMRWEGECHGSG